MSTFTLSFLLLIAINTINAQAPVRPTKTVNNTEYYIATSSVNFEDQTIICNYYNPNETHSPHNCEILCNTHRGCSNTYVDCSNSPYCHMDCQYSQSCVGATFNGRNSNSMYLYCFSNKENGMFPCVDINVFGPQNIYNSTSKILCRGEQSCYNAKFDISQSTYSSIYCKDIKTLGPFFGSTCNSAIVNGTQHTVIKCEGGRVCAGMQVTLTHYSNALPFNTKDTRNIRCWGEYFWACSRIWINAATINNFHLWCNGTKACANALVQVSSTAISNNKIECIPDVPSFNGANGTCEYMQIYTEPRYSLGWLNLTCIESGKYDFVCGGIEMYCAEAFESNIPRLEPGDNSQYEYHEENVSINEEYKHIKYYDYGYYECKPMSESITFTEWPLLNITNTPTSTDNSTMTAIFDLSHVYQLQFHQIECTSKYSSCIIKANNYFALQGAYVMFNSDTQLQNVNVNCSNHGCVHAYFNIGNVDTFGHRCYDWLSCYNTIFSLENINNSVDINCGYWNGSQPYNPNAPWPNYGPPEAMCYNVIINTKQLSSELNINCVNATSINCPYMTMNGQNNQDVNLNCVNDRSCYGIDVNLNDIGGLNINCMNASSCAETNMIISDSNGDININCISDDACTQSQFIFDANKYGIHNVTNINCSGTYACELSQFKSQIISEYDILYNVECNGEYACASSLFSTPADNINIDCNAYQNGRSCLDIYVELNGNNSILNMDCNGGYETCMNGKIMAENDNSFVNLNCGNDATYHQCNSMFVAVSSLSNHTNIHCGDCSDMSIAVPSHYNTPDFISMSCLTDRKCNNKTVNINALDLYCYNATNANYSDDNTWNSIECNNGYPFPLINTNIKPSVTNQTGVYFIANDTSLPLALSYALIECNKYGIKPCYFQCNQTHGCSHSVFVQNNNNLSITCDTLYGCDGLYVNYSNTNFTMNCNTAHACNININGTSNSNSSIYCNGSVSQPTCYNSQYNFDDNSNILVYCNGSAGASTQSCIYSLDINVTNSKYVIIEAFNQVSHSRFSIESVQSILFNAYNKNSLDHTNITTKNINSANISCMATNGCNTLIIKDESDSNISLNCANSNACSYSHIISDMETHLNVFCGFNNANGITGQCATLSILPSKLSNHTDVKCGDCSYLNIYAAYDYENNFIAITCLTDHKYCNQVSFSGLNIACYNETNPNINLFPELVNCKGLSTPYPLINSAIPSVINNSGIYYISSATDAYEFGYANITCDNNKSLPCIFQCNGQQSCARSMITSNRNKNDLIFEANGNMALYNTYIKYNNSNVSMVCTGKNSCDSMIIKGSNNYNTSLICATTDYSCLDIQLSLENSEYITLFAVQNTVLDKITMNITNTSYIKINAMDSGAIKEGTFNIHSAESVQLYAENNGDSKYYITQSNFNLIEVNEVNINCNGDFVCNNLLFNIYNDTTNVSAIFDNKFNHNPTGNYIHLYAQNANQLNMTFAAKLADSIFVAPSYDSISNKTKSYLYCNDYGCNNIRIQSLNGLSDWNISIGGECQCDKINDCVYSWEIDCGASGQNIAHWYGNNYCTGSNECCSNSSAIQLVDEYDDFLNTCPHNKKKDLLSTLDYIIIVICSVGIVIVAICIGICCNWYLKKKDGNKGYSKIEE